MIESKPMTMDYIVGYVRKLYGSSRLYLNDKLI